MELDKSIVEQLKSVHPQTSTERDWYGPYNSLLALLFPFHEGFQISPQWDVQDVYGEPQTFSSTNFMTFHYAVHKDDHIVFLFQVEARAGQKPSTFERANADRRIRNVFRRNGDDPLSKIPKLYAISALGTDFAVYDFTKSTQRMGPSVANSRELYKQDFADIAPSERWKHNILTKAGFAKLQEITDEVKGMVKAHHVNLVSSAEQKKKRRIA